MPSLSAIAAGLAHRWTSLLYERPRRQRRCYVDSRQRGELLRAFRQPGCAVCRVLVEHRRLFLLWFCLENYAAEPLVFHLRRSGGFCPPHTRMILEYGPTYAMSYVARYLSEAMLEQVRRSLSARRRRETFSQQAECPLCEQHAAAERSIISSLSVLLEDPEVARRYTESDGLCGPHTRAVARQVEPGWALTTLLGKEESRLDGFLRELYEYARKVDYRFAHEPKGPEQTAWRRTLAHLAGLWEADAPAAAPPTAVHRTISASAGGPASARVGSGDGSRPAGGL